MDYIPPVYQKFYEELDSKESDQDTSSIDDETDSGEVENLTMIKHIILFKLWQTPLLFKLRQATLL